jgi:hypothetical protein
MKDLISSFGLEVRVVVGVLFVSLDLRAGGTGKGELEKCQYGSMSTWPAWRASKQTQVPCKGGFRGDAFRMC